MLLCNLWSVFDQQIPVLFFSMSSPMTVRETPLICTFPSGSREEMPLFVLHRWICANTLILLRWDGKYVSMPFHILSASQITSTERKIIYIYIHGSMFRIPAPPNGIDYHVAPLCVASYLQHFQCSASYMQAICNISDVHLRPSIFHLPPDPSHPTTHYAIPYSKCILNHLYKKRNHKYIYIWFHAPYSYPTIWYKLPCSTRCHSV